MSPRRVEATASRTAEWTCLARAVSYYEPRGDYHSDDRIAPILIPGFARLFVRTRLMRTIFRRWLVPPGSFEYVVARTRYIDDGFRRALDEGFDQFVLCGAGFDTRALRFTLGAARVFELDVPTTQIAKQGRYLELGLDVPPNLIFVAIDFDKESFATKLEAGGFDARQRTLFLLEGVLMYLQPDAAAATFEAIRGLAALGSRVVFDYALASVLRRENKLYGEDKIVRAVSAAGEAWHFGIEPSEVEAFLAAHGLRLRDHQDAQGLERMYFQHSGGRVMGVHGLVLAERA